MNSFVDLQVNALCIFILTLLLFHLKYNTARMLEERLFDGVIFASIAILVFDTIAWELDGAQFIGARQILMISNTLYFFLTGLISFLWMLYTDYCLFSSLKRLKKIAPIYAIPFAVIIVIDILTPFTGWAFYLDAVNVYNRGGFFFYLHTALSWAMLLHTAVLALKKSRTEVTKARRHECYLLTTFIFLPLAGGLVQALFFTVSLLLVTSTAALLMIFLNIQNRQIYTDALTGINNRRTLNRFLETKQYDIRSGDALYLIIIDIDNFKQINDNYGHSVGDNALICVAEVLKRVCGRGNDFLARYGGDEFAIVCIRADNDPLKNELIDIQLELEETCSTLDAPYSLSLSAGFAKMDMADPRGIDNLISIADANMYKKKRENKIAGQK